jgi:hypothetical protein
VVVLVRRAAMIALGITLVPATRQFLVALASLAFLLLHFAAWPYNTTLENVVEAACLALLTFIAMAETSYLAQMPGEQFAVTAAVSAAFVAGVAIVICALVYSNRARAAALWQHVRAKCGGAPSGSPQAGRDLEEKLLGTAEEAGL